MQVLPKHIRIVGSVGSGGNGWYLSPHGFNLYRVQPGDTFESLAARWLGNASRAAEIFMLQSQAWREERGENSDDLHVGDQLFMPQEAIDTAKRLGFAKGGSGEPPGLTHITTGGRKSETPGTDILVTPSAPSSPATPPNVHPTAPSSPDAPENPVVAFLSTTKGKLIAGGGALAVVGIAAVALSSGKPARRRNPGKKRRGGLGAAWRAAPG